MRSFILESAYAYKLSEVQISTDNINQLIEEITKEHGTDCPKKLEEKDTQQAIIQKYFLGNSINFCFWFSNCHEKYQNNGLSSSEAMWNSLESIDDLFDMEYLKQMTYSGFYNIFGKMPMSDERMENLKEVGTVLSQYYDGKAINILSECDYDAKKVMFTIAKRFRTWNDCYGDTLFYKRIQSFLNNIINDKRCTDLIKPSTTDCMTILADYHVPKLLHHYNILVYSDELERKIRNNIFIESRSKEENDIRVATIIAGDIILDRIKEIGINMTVTQLDGILWRLGRNIKESYHLCKSIWY